MKTWDITLLSIFRVVIFLIVWLVVFILLLILNAKVLDFSPLPFVVIGVAIPVIYMSTLQRNPAVNYFKKITLTDESLRVDTTSYRFADLVWYRMDTNSPVLQRLVLKFKGSNGKVALTVATGAKTEVEKLTSIYQQVKVTADRLQLPVRNYYDTKAWRVAAWITLLSAPALWIVLPLLDNPIRPILAPLLVWSGTATAFFAMIMANRQHKAKG
ncbi:MAG: hypothetical protein AAF798_23260 [Bacteroidota bacterium]